MIRALNVSSTRRISLQADPDRGTPEESIFIIGTLDSRVMTYLSDNSLAVVPDESSPNGEHYSLRSGHTNLETVAFGLRGFEKFFRDSGDEVEFKTRSRSLGSTKYEVVHPDILRILPPEVIAELAEQIRSKNLLTSDAEKN